MGDGGGDQGGEQADWSEIFSEYRATVDWPGCAFWHELAEAYPKAKMLLTGAGVLAGDDTAVELESGSSGIIWPTDVPARFTATEPVEMLRGWVPELAQDVARHGAGRRRGEREKPVADILSSGQLYRSLCR